MFPHFLNQVLIDVCVVAVMAFSFYPVIGIGISAYIKALGTAKHLHKAVSRLYTAFSCGELIL